MPRYIDLEDHDFREVPGKGALARLGDTPTVFRQEGQLLSRERRRVTEQFEEPDDPFILQEDEDDAWGTSILTLDDVEEAQRRGIPMGQLRPLTAEKPRPTGTLISRFVSAAGRAVTSAGEAISEGVQAVGTAISEAGEAVAEGVASAFDPANIPGTSENLQMGTMKLLDRALKPAWVQMYTGDANNPSLMEFHRRIKDFLAATSMGQMPTYQAGPPTGAASEGAAEIVAQYGGTPTMGWVTAVSTALNLAQGFIQGQYAERAQELMAKLDMPSIQEAVKTAIQEYMAAGGLPAQIGEMPPNGYVTNFEMQVQKDYTGPRVKGDDKKRPKSSWWYQYVLKMGDDFKSFLPALRQASAAMKMSIDAYNKTTMPKTVEACGAIAARLLKQGVIQPGEVNDVVALLHKHYQGYVLTDAERALFNRIEPYITGSTGKKVAVGVGAAAAVAALLSMF